MRLDDLEEGPVAQSIAKGVSAVARGAGAVAGGAVGAWDAAKKGFQAGRATVGGVQPAPTQPAPAQASAAQQKATKIPSEPFFQARKQQYLNRVQGQQAQAEQPAAGQAQAGSSNQYGAWTAQAQPKPAATQAPASTLSTGGKATATFGGTAAPAGAGSQTVGTQQPAAKPAPPPKQPTLQPGEKPEAPQQAPVELATLQKTIGGLSKREQQKLLTQLVSQLGTPVSGA